MDSEEPVPNEKSKSQLTTWVFEHGSFVPQAKIVGNKTYSIICDYLGTPVQAFDDNGENVWECELDIYGKVRSIEGSKTFIPFRYQGQYEDEETGLYYNRFRYYSPDTGTYISQDPIRLEGNNPNFYAYTFDSNLEIDPFGLDCNIAATKKLADKVSNKFKQIFKCEEFADSLKKMMKKEGIPGEHVKVTGKTPNIFSDKHGVIASSNKYSMPTHDAIKVDDMIFDNMNPKGVKYDDWVQDIGGDYFNDISSSIF